MEDHYYPIVGYGHRPKGAKNCGIFADNTISNTYGMPSGHAQCAGFFFIYELYQNNFSNSTAIIFFNCCFYLAYTRVTLGCHTFQQSIVGFIIGEFTGYLIHAIT